MNLPRTSCFCHKIYAFGLGFNMAVILSAQSLTKSYGVRPLFTGLSVNLDEKDRIGLIGPNGAGKSTFLKLLANHEVPDEGNVSCRRSTRIGYVAQDDRFPEGQTVRDVLIAAQANLNREDYEQESEAAIILTNVGFSDPDQPAASLSGGWRKRLGLARELVKHPDFLLMDEPTNHLDLPGVAWLEKLLRSSSFGYLVATHDRAFLRAVADEIIEISRVYPSGVFRSVGNYDTFAERRDLFLEAQARQQESVANQVRRETEWLGHKARARTRKASSRIQAAAERREELSELQHRTAAANTAGVDFVSTGRKTKKLLSANGISKALGGKRLFNNLEFILQPGMVLGLLGPNGSGKSTLLKTLSGQLTPDSGTVTLAENLRLEVFEQGRSSLDPNTPLRRALSPNSDTVMFRDRPLHIAAWAKMFLFRPEQLDLELNALSGGEQARVRIAQLMLRPADLLFLDEPTNDLDIPSLEVLEDSLEEFPGAIVLVSHDRDLMDRLCTEVIGLDGEGNASLYGSVDQWLAAFQTQSNERKRATTAPASSSKKPSNAAAAEPKKKKLSFKEQQEFIGMEATILAAEEKLASKHAAVEQAANSGHLALTQACRELELAQLETDKLYARWQELEAKSQG
jgi:ABC transport system ATP-binding/permease protein